MGRMRWVVGLVVVAALVAGCSSKPAPAGPAAAVAPEDAWHGEAKVRLVQAAFNGFEADLPACGNGGASTTANEFQRTAETVHNGTGHLEVTVQTDDGWPGLQVGYLVDGDKDYTWLPTVHGAAQTFHVPVAPAQWEDAVETARWHFNHRDNLPGPAQQDCWAGGGSGTWSVSVDAVRGP